jgi:enoyl-CoA hydratase/carnithine racemase
MHLSSFVVSLFIATATSTANDGSSSGYGTLKIAQNGSITRVTIDHPPINLFDVALATDFRDFFNGLKSQGLTNETNTGSTKVIIIDSANPDFWISHFDIATLAQQTEHGVPPGNLTLLTEEVIELTSNLRNLPLISIAEINGRASGVGNEIAVQTDIRYAGPNTKLSQFEIGFGLPPGGGGIQFLTALVGRARALENILSARSVDTVEAERIGWVNRGFQSAGELEQETLALAERIATFPVEGLAAAKIRVNVQKPSDESVLGDLQAFSAGLAQNVTQRANVRFLELGDGQSNGPFEKNVPEDIDQVLK